MGREPPVLILCSTKLVKPISDESFEKIILKFHQQCFKFQLLTPINIPTTRFKYRLEVPRHFNVIFYVASFINIYISRVCTLVAYTQLNSPGIVSIMDILVPLITLICSSLRFKYRKGKVPDSTLTKILGTRISSFSVRFGIDSNFTLFTLLQEVFNPCRPCIFTICKNIYRF